MKEEWLLPDAVVSVDVETTAALVAEIHRLIDVVGGLALAQPAREPVLQDIEQYRMQMAAICTAAIGYWTEYDSIGPDYDTLALRDVAKLYEKYDALYKAQPAGAKPTPAAYAQGYAEGFNDACKPATEIPKIGCIGHDCAKCKEALSQRQWVGLTRREFEDATSGLEDLEDCWIAIEAKLKERNE
tara:strand:- start:218 stop:775 length:558 start_codon:yes stop_codon:yes gene_type:complete